MTAAWDTTVASRLGPGNAYERRLLERAVAGEPVTLTAPTVLEITYGLASTASPGMRRALAWFTGLAASDLITVLPLDATAAVVAGRLRVRRPMPPTGTTRRAGTRPEQRAGWVLDLQIAACAWTHGHAIATDNLRDFDAIAQLIAELYPGVSSLDVAEPPRP